jgi:hypothetical protein
MLQHSVLSLLPSTTAAQSLTTLGASFLSQTCPSNTRFKCDADVKCAPVAAAAVAATALLVQMHPNLVASPFLYADNAPDGSSRELDVVEFARWAQPSIPNSQYVVQPWTSNAPHVFNVSGVGHTHRMRWSGSSIPQQVQFESYAADGRLIHSWTNTGEVQRAVLGFVTPVFQQLLQVQLPTCMQQMVG